MVSAIAAAAVTRAPPPARKRRRHVAGRTADAGRVPAPLAPCYQPPDPTDGMADGGEDPLRIAPRRIERQGDESSERIHGSSIRGAERRSQVLAWSGPADETIVHGGDLDAARARISVGAGAMDRPVDRHQSARLSVCAASPPKLGSGCRNASADRAVRQAAAKRYGAADVGMLVAAPGSQALIQIVPRLIEDADVAVLGPDLCRARGGLGALRARVREIASLTDMGDARVVVVVNPNNPTGRIVAADDLRRVAERLAQRGGLLVVDEAFADFAAPGVSVIPQLPPATVVLRSFGKAYGLAGVRLGFAVAHVEHRAADTRWSSGRGPCRGRRSLSVPQALADTQLARGDRATSSMQDCQRLDALLAASGSKLEGGTHLFRLVSHLARATSPMHSAATAFTCAASRRIRSGCASVFRIQATRGSASNCRCATARHGSRPNALLRTRTKNPCSSTRQRARLPG